MSSIDFLISVAEISDCPSLSSKNYLSGLAELKALTKIIQDSVDSIEAATTRNSVEYPSSATPFSIESEAALTIPEVEKACTLIVSAANQLVYTARSPMQSVIAAAMQVCDPLRYQVPKMT
jgi:hypothetical protein